MRRFVGLLRCRLLKQAKGGIEWQLLLGRLRLPQHSLRHFQAHRLTGKKCSISPLLLARGGGYCNNGERWCGVAPSVSVCKLVKL